jgi:hypothetical protein
MNKKIKELIEKKKLTDDQIIALLEAAEKPSADSESESEEGDEAEEPSAEKEKDQKPKEITLKDFEAMVSKAVKSALGEDNEKPGKIIPEKKKVPPPTQPAEKYSFGGFQMVN